LLSLLTGIQSSLQGKLSMLTAEKVLALEYKQLNR